MLALGRCYPVFSRKTSRWSMAAKELKTFTNRSFFQWPFTFEQFSADKLRTENQWCFNESGPFRSRFREDNFKRKWWRNLTKRVKSQLRKSIAALKLLQLHKTFSFWTIVRTICLAIKAFFWPIQFGRDKQFATWNMCRFSQLFNDLPKWDGWRSLKCD